MNKQEFLDELRARLSGLPTEELEERLGFWAEMIDDRTEEGMTEQEAVADIGSVEQITEQILSEIPLSKLAKEKIRSGRKLRACEITLLAVGSPIWVSLLISAFAVLIVLFATLWAVIASLWAVFGALVGAAVGGVAGGVLLIVLSYPLSGILLIGAGLACSGLAIFLFFGCLWATKGSAWLMKQSVLGIKKCFVRKERV